MLTLTEDYFEDWTENRPWEENFVCVVMHFPTRGASNIKYPIVWIVFIKNIELTIRKTFFKD